MNLLSNTFAKILIAIALVAGGFYGVSIALKSTSSHSETSSSDSTSATSATLDEQSEKESITDDQKLLVLMSNISTEGQIGISAEQLRNGTYEINAVGPEGMNRTKTVSSIVATRQSKEQETPNLENAPYKDTKIYTVTPNLGGASTIFIVEPDRAILMAVQNVITDYKNATTNSAMALSMSNDEMQTYLDDNKDTLSDLVDKISVTDTPSEDA